MKNGKKDYIIIDKSLFKNVPFPLNPKLSFKPILAHWESIESDKDHVQHSYALEVLQQVRAIPELLSDDISLEVVDRYQDILRQLLSPLFPEMLTENEIKAISLPMKGVFFNLSKRFERIHECAEEEHFEFRAPDDDQMYKMNCAFLLTAYYGLDVKRPIPMFFESFKDGSKIKKYYRIFFNGDFATIKPTADAPQLTEDELADLVDHLDDVDVCRKYIPPQSFDIIGFGLATLFDVTVDESISALKDDLLKRHALYDPLLVEDIETHLSSLLQIDDLTFGISIFDQDKQRITNIAAPSGVVY